MKRIFCLFLAAVPLCAAAYVNPGAPAGFVNDFAGMLSPQDRSALESKLAAFEKETSNEISVATIPSLRGDTIENFSVKLFEDWGIGKKNRDNGVLLLIARDDHKIRIEVGYGLEGALTDAQSFSIINDIVQPAFRAGNYSGGISQAVDAIMAATQGEYTPSASRDTFGTSPAWYGAVVWFGIFIFVQVLRMLAVSKSWWGGGVLGGIIGLFVALFFGFLYAGLFAISILIPLGFILDFFLSRSYARHRELGTFPWWFARGRFGRGLGDSDFRGFGGGRSGGGGASGGW